MPNSAYKSTLHEMTQTTPTALWNDSCSVKELTASIETNGAVGATCNPVIVMSVLKKEMPSVEGSHPRDHPRDVHGIG